MNDENLKQAAAEKLAVPAWEQAVAAHTKALDKGLTSTREDLRELATSPLVVNLICGLLRVYQAEGLRWMLLALSVDAVVTEWSDPPAAFLFSRLSAFKELIAAGHDAEVLRKVVTTQYAPLRPILRIPAIESIMEEFVRKRSVTDKPAVPLALPKPHARSKLQG